jgi:hypothetical protein
MEVIALIVAVERSLHHIKDGLEEMGYDIVDLEENASSDAIVYYRDGQDHRSEEMSHNSFSSGASAVNGTFLVNAYDKSIDEIDQILKKRSYSPLFTGFE